VAQLRPGFGPKMAEKTRLPDRWPISGQLLAKNGPILPAGPVVVVNPWTSVVIGDGRDRWQEGYTLT
jgi:hypothetical protein